MLIGVTMGFAMGVTHHFEFAPVHAHLNLLGWASLGLAGCIYHIYPEAAKTKLAQLHFWLHNIGLPVFMAGLFAQFCDVPAAEPFVRIGAGMTYAGIVWFVVNLLRHRMDQSRTATRLVSEPVRSASEFAARRAGTGPGP
jgi:hypothetical protein